MGTDQPTPRRRWRPRFSLLTLVLGVIFAGACGGLWYRWEPYECDEILRGHTAGVRSAIFSKDAQRVVTASEDKTARVWDSEAGTELCVLRGHGDTVAFASFSPDGAQIVTKSWDSTVRVWNAQTGALVRRLSPTEEHYNISSLVGFSSDDRWIMAGIGRTARVWDRKSGDMAFSLNAGEPVFCAVFSPDGRQIATVACGQSLQIWDVEKRTVLKEICPFMVDGEQNVHGGELTYVTFTPDGRCVVTADDGHAARVWSLESWKGIDVFRCPTSSIHKLSFAPDQWRVVTTGDDNVAHIWDRQTATAISALRGHDGEVYSAFYSNDGMRIVTASADGTARVWSRRRPEYWWGIAWLPESWIALLSGGALAVIAVRRLRARKAARQEAA